MDPNLHRRALTSEARPRGLGSGGVYPKRVDQVERWGGLGRHPAGAWSLVCLKWMLPCWLRADAVHSLLRQLASP